MKTDFILPDIGEGVVECELVDWLVEEGDVVAEDQPIADVMTDKALVQIPAPQAGTITNLYYGKGEIAKVHQPLYAIEVGDISGDVGEKEGKNISQPTTTGEVEQFLLPDIGEGIVECELVEWLVGVGDMVCEDQPIADVMTDKALVQIPAVKNGKITELYYRTGQLAKVHQPLYSIEVTQLTDRSALPVESKLVANQTDTPQAIINSQKGTIHHGKALASPAVRRLARSHNINLAEVAGTGKHGRVYKEDIERLLDQSRQQDKTIVPIANHGASTPGESTRVEPIRGIKAVMAKAMIESVSSIPHFTYCEEFDLTALVSLRESMKARYSSDELKLTLMPFFMKAMSLALKEFPIMNSSPNDDCTELTYFSQHNIGMAVDSKVGLLVPNVKNVERKSILEIAKEITRLSRDARNGRVAQIDLQQGTISISNIGALGGTVATPIVNKPEVAIVALGRIQTLPRFNPQGDVEARKIMQISWSGDHRIIDGGTIARFCNVWKHYLEQPEEMLLSLS